MSCVFTHNNDPSAIHTQCRWIRHLFMHGVAVHEGFFGQFLALLQSSIGGGVVYNVFEATHKGSFSNATA